MTEANTVNSTTQPNTISTLVRDFQKLGIKRNDTIIFHSAMSKLGWTVGGAVTVIDALLKVLTPNGTLVMPAFSSSNSEPSYWENPPVPEEWWKPIRDEMPAFRPEVTPTRGLGRIPELFRTYPNVLRSNHPMDSFAAWGKHAETIISNHKLEEGLGNGSPLGRLYDLDAKILLLGVTHANNTSLHLAEHRAVYPAKKIVTQGAAWMVAGQRRWITWDDLDYDDEDFQELGAAFEKSIQYTPQKVGQAEARLHSQRAVVDFGVGWLSAHRKEPSQS